MKKYKNYIFIGLLILLTLWVIIPQLDGLHDSIVALKDANLYWILLGTVIFFSGIPVLTLQFVALALKPLKFGLTYKVEMAGLFVGKLLPSALGTISLNMYYFIKKNHTVSQATAVMTMNTITSTVAYFLLILLALFTGDQSIQGLIDAVELPIPLIIVITLALLVIGYLLHRSTKVRSWLRVVWISFRKDVATYKKHPRVIGYGLVCNFIGSFTSLFALYAAAQAIGVDLSLAGALLAYTFGNVASALVPTPGGIGAAEAGIYSGLVLVGMAGPDAIIVTLLYRLITYWLPILPGYYFFWDLRKSVLADFNIKKSYSK